MSWINDTFPALNLEVFKVTSPKSSEYNCIAWAASDCTQWWSHCIHSGYYWPPNVPRNELITSLIAVFEGIGFVECEDAELESCYEKIVLYAKNNLWTHAARQLSNGLWTSKLGHSEDITHATPECLVGESYGQIHCFMKRPIAASTSRS